VGALSGALATYVLLRSFQSESEQFVLHKDVNGPLARFGFPESTISAKNHGSYVVGYDRRMRTAAWVYERLTLESVKGDAKREGSFVEDLAVLQEFRTSASDYRGSGMDRGHLAPANDYKSSQEAMNETFKMSNMAPQVPNLNRGFWKKLEDWVRDLTVTFAEVHVITGPLWIPAKREEDEKWILTTEFIGHSHISRLPIKRNRLNGEISKISEAPVLPIPTHFFKVVLGFKEQSMSPFIAAFVVPNQPIDERHPLSFFRIPLQLLESLSGVLMFPKLLHNETTLKTLHHSDLCAETSCDFKRKAFRKKEKQD